MATLSANSRRNSAASSITNSPRPSISVNCGQQNSAIRMSSLNEEDDSFDGCVHIYIYLTQLKSIYFVSDSSSFRWLSMRIGFLS